MSTNPEESMKSPVEAWHDSAIFTTFLTKMRLAAEGRCGVFFFFFAILKGNNLRIKLPKSQVRILQLYHVIEYSEFKSIKSSVFFPFFPSFPGSFSSWVCPWFSNFYYNLDKDATSSRIEGRCGVSFFFAILKGNHLRIKLPKSQVRVFQLYHVIYMDTLMRFVLSLLTDILC